MTQSGLFVVADDLGLDPAVNDGIFFAYKNGLINGASIMANGLAFDHAVTNLKQFSSLKIGIHLVLVEEKSILMVPEVTSLISGGALHKNHRIFFLRYLLGLIKKDEIKKELEAQVQKCLQSGLRPEFLNSHQHLHLLPGIMNIFIKLAKQYEIPYIRLVKEPLLHHGSLFRRVQLIFLRFLSRLAKKKIIRNGLNYNEFFVGFINAGNLGRVDIVLAQKLAGKYPNETIELGCHPGFETNDLRYRYKHWGYNWQKEIDVLSADHRN